MNISKAIVYEALKPVMDPEINLSVVDLGLIYDVRIDNKVKKITVDMTLTSPMCPYGPMLIAMVDDAVKVLPGIKETEVKVVWEPQWDPKKMASDEVKDKLGIW